MDGERKRQAFKAKKDLEYKKQMQDVTEPKRPTKTRTHNQKRLSSAEIAEIENLVTVNGEQCVVRWLASTPRAQMAQDAAHWARGTLKALRDPNAPHKSILFDVAAALLANFGKPQTQQRVEAVTVPVEVTERRITVEPKPHQPPLEETGIVQVVDGVPWTLPTLTKVGAEQARVRLTDLARYLVYKDKDSLRQLADRNATELAEFGEICAVQVSVQRGPITYQALEPIYNPDQAAYLALSSETPQGRACRVRILKSHKALLAMFEQIVKEQPQTSVLERALVVMAQSQQALVASQNTTNALLQSLLERQPRTTRSAVNTGQQVAPQAVEQPSPEPPIKSEFRRLAEQDQATERKVLNAMIKRLAGVTKGMATVEYGARMSVAFHQIEDELPKYGHNMTEDLREAYLSGRRVNSLDYFEEKGIVRLVMGIVDKLYEAKQASNAEET